MKVGKISQTNSKGQVVIPKSIRDELGITAGVPLNIVQRGMGVYIFPIKDVVSAAEEEPTYVEILEKTKGSWAGDDWTQVRKERKETELEASKKRKEQW